jgi:ABC-type ATPase involved in cell division
VIEVSDLTVRFGGVTPLDGMSVTFEQGTCGLIGPNGAGKTTFFNVLSGFVKPVSGTVTTFGEDLLRMAHFRRARWGVRRTFQTEQAIEELSVYENVAMIHEHSKLSRASRKQDVLGAITFVGIDVDPYSIVGTLGAANRRLVEVARAIVGKPQLVLLADARKLGRERLRRGDRLRRERRQSPRHIARHGGRPEQREDHLPHRQGVGAVADLRAEPGHPWHVLAPTERDDLDSSVADDAEVGALACSPEQLLDGTLEIAVQKACLLGGCGQLLEAARRPVDALALVHREPLLAEARQQVVRGRGALAEHVSDLVRAHARGPLGEQRQNPEDRPRRAEAAARRNGTRSPERVHGLTHHVGNPSSPAVRSRSPDLPPQ